MKRFANATLMTTLLLNFSLLSPALAEKLDLSTHNSLIQKLESAAGLDSRDSMIRQTSLAHRLADLYAERARLLAMEKNGQGAQIYKSQIDKDRRKSISILKNIVSSLPIEEQGTTLLQMAHLHELLQEPAAALNICKDVEKNSVKYDGKTVALAQIQLGDADFYKGELFGALKHFEKAQKSKENPRMAYTRFRLAWVHYNLGQSHLAEKELIALLENTKLFVGDNGAVETSFQEDVSRDLATFMAKNDIDDQSIAILQRLSPESARKKNLIYLAEELDRTAKKKSALKVWDIVGAQSISFEDRVDRQIQIAKIEYDLGHKSQLIQEVDNSIALLKSPKCLGNQECTVATQNLRHILTDWAKAEERIPSAELIVASNKYIDNFDDYEMCYWAAQASTKRHQYREAMQFYVKAAALLHSKTRDTAQMQRMHEGALLGSIEAAEMSKDSDLRLKAYQQYLDLNPKGQKASEVRYQIAHWYYEKNDYSKASEEFRKLALDEKMPRDLREKSGDLCLDSDVILKNESQIEAHSLELAQNLKSKQSEYLAIWRKSILNQTAKIINETPAPNVSSVFPAELRKIQNLNISSFSKDERKQLVKNKVVMSYKLKDLDSLSQSTREFLALRNLNREERAMGIGYMAWIAEVRMNFTEAIHYMAQLKPSSKELPDYYFKMAMLRELAEQNPVNEYMKFLKLSHNSQKRQYAAHQVVIHSHRPATDFRKFESLLSRNSELYRSAGIFAYEKSHDQNLAKKLLSRASFRHSPEGQLLSHQSAFRELRELTRKMAQIRLRGGSDIRLKRDLDQRIRLLKQLERMTNIAIRQRDTTRELIDLAELSSQNSKLAQEILALPIPRGLKGAQRQQYAAQVQDLVRPYQTQAQAILAKNQEIWKQAMDQNTFQNLFDWSIQRQKPGSQIAATEIAVLRASARQSGLSSDPFGNLSEESLKVALEARTLQQRLKKNPFNSEDLEKMKSLHTRLGSGPMVAYLDQRLNELKARGSQN